MMIAKKEKGKKIILYKDDDAKRIIESFSLLKLNVLETNQLMLAASYWNSNKGIFYTTYEHNDNLDKNFKAIACEHQQTSNIFKDVNKGYINNIEGTSMLVRDVQTKTIKIVKRKSRFEKCYLNVTPISNLMRELFFNACKKSNYYLVTGKYAIDFKDYILYSFWGKFMDEQFERISMTI